MNRKRVVILGATGSIGESALKVARDIPEQMEIVGLAAKSNARKLAAAANEVRPELVCLVEETQIDVLREALDYEPRIFAGEEGLREIACLTNGEMVLVAIVLVDSLRLWYCILRGTEARRVHETPFQMTRLQAEEL